MRPLRVLTWHVHGTYLYYLAHARHDFYIPLKPGRPQGYGGRSGPFPWPDNVIEVPAEEISGLDLDCIIFQSRDNYLKDQFDILSESQRKLPRMYVEHDPPREHPTDTRHVVEDQDVLLVHVTHFNNLMWDCGLTPTRVIEHGVKVPQEVRHVGDLGRGLVVVNNLESRGRRLGRDVFEDARQGVPLDLVGMGSELLGGLGEVPYRELHAFSAAYRFLFNPIRYTSLGLAVCEAMMVGLPIIGLATTEMATAVKNGISGYVHTNLDYLMERMQELLADPAEARRLGDGARRVARERFGIDRFVRDWEDAISDVTDQRAMARAPLPRSAGSDRAVDAPEVLR